MNAPVVLFDFSYPSFTLLVSALLLYLLYSLLEYQVFCNYWSSKNISGPRALPFVGVSYKFIFQSFPEVYGKWIKQFGSVFGTYEAKTKCLVIADADLIKDVLIKNFHKFTDRRVVLGHWIFTNQLINQRGNEWRKSRSIMSPAFSSGKMKLMYPMMKECYSLLEREMIRYAANGQEVATKEIFAKLTTTVIMRCAFATKVDPFAEEKSRLMFLLNDWMTFRPIRQLTAVTLPSRIKKAIQYSAVDSHTMKGVIGICKTILKERRTMNASCQTTDLLQLLMEAGNKEKNDESNNVPDHEAHYLLQSQMDEKKVWEQIEKSKRKFTDDEIIANIVLFFLAGYDTTSTLLTNSSYLLAMNPEIQEKLYFEIKKSLDGMDIKNLQYEQLTSIKYLDAFISEVLRLFPATTRLERVAVEDHTFENDIHVEKDTVIQIPIYNVHHDPKYFHEPEKFDPERFLSENRSQIRPGSYLPFVIGPKNCIGMRFALMEAKVALANMLMKFQIVPCEKTKHLKVKFRPYSFLLSMVDDVVVTFCERK